jgi:hypothetical protein
MSCFGVASALDGGRQSVITVPNVDTGTGTVPVHTAIGDARRSQNNMLTTTKMRLLQQQQEQLSQVCFI